MVASEVIINQASLDSCIIHSEDFHVDRYHFGVYKSSLPISAFKDDLQELHVSPYKMTLHSQFIILPSLVSGWLRGREALI